MNHAGHQIVVVGAGASGLACAISAAAEGAEVCLVEKSGSLGGTVTSSLIHTIGGLYDDEGEYINLGLPVELSELLLQADPHTRKRNMGKVWTLNVDPGVYGQVVEQWVVRQTKITVLRGTYPTQIHTNGPWVAQLEVYDGIEKRQLPVGALVDATGTAEVTRLLDIHKLMPGDALAGLVFQIRGVAENALGFPKNIGVRRTVQTAVEEGRLPQAFAGVWFDSGVYADEVYAKLNIPSHAYDREIATTYQENLAGFMTQLADFAHAHITRMGCLGIRDGGRIKGDYCLTLEDIKNGREFTDSAGRCAWPVEYWDPLQGVKLDYLPPKHSYQIPLRSLKVTGMENLWAAGKCLSADKLAQASARVVGTCWAMGDALGKALTRQKT